MKLRNIFLQLFFGLYFTTSFAGAPLSIYPAFGQEIKTNLPFIGLINSFVKNDSLLFAGGSTGVFLSTNNGKSWSKVNNGLLDSSVNCLALNGTYLFAGTSKSLYLSTNYGASWIPVNQGLPIGLPITAILTMGVNTFVGVGGFGVFFSTDNGVNWVQKSTGLPPGTAPTSFAVIGQNLFTTTGRILFRSINGGTNWTSTNTSATSLAVIGKNLIASQMGLLQLCDTAGLSHSKIDGLFGITAVGDGKIYSYHPWGFSISSNNGISWDTVGAGLPIVTSVYTLFANGTNVYAGTNEGVFISTNSGITWSQSNNGFNNPSPASIQALVRVDSNLVASSLTSGIFYSIDTGHAWKQTFVGLWKPQIQCLIAKGSMIFAGDSSGIFRSSDAGATWTESDSGLPKTTKVLSLGFCGELIFAGTSGKGIYVSGNNGATWNTANSGLGFVGNTKAYSIAVSGNDVFVSLNSFVYLSSNSGTSWTKVSSGLNINFPVSSLAISGKSVFAEQGGNGFYKFDESTVSWTLVDPTLYSVSSHIFVNEKSIFRLFGNNNKLSLSTDGGTKWSTYTFGLTGATAATALGSDLFVGSGNQVITFKFNAPSLILPTLKQVFKSSDTIPLRWSRVCDASVSQLQVSTDSSMFAKSFFNDSSLNDTTKNLVQINSGIEYFWRVREKNPGGWGPFSHIGAFKVENTLSIQQPNTSVTKKWKVEGNNIGYGIVEFRVFIPKSEVVKIDGTDLLGNHIFGYNKYFKQGEYYFQKHLSGRGIIYIHLIANGKELASTIIKL